MKKRILTKLQIRSEINSIIQKAISVDVLGRDDQLKYIKKLESIEDREYVAEILAKELGKSDFKSGQLIVMFLQEIGNLEVVNEILWSYIKSPYITDEIKDLCGVVLKNLGDQTDTEEFLSYLKNPKDIVDKETKKLLEFTSLNPEAKIDFLDFLFSLPHKERINLINSLKEDYSSNYIVNVVIPALESGADPEMDELLIEILGETKSIKAVPILNDIIKYSNEEKKKKKAKVALNLLRLSGIKIDESTPRYPEEITQVSNIYECHVSIPDGAGNQAFIISRIKNNGDIFMMNLVTNDVYGIVDCFGFWGISKKDLKRIVEKFQEKATRFLVPAEYCKYMISEAEKINKINNSYISYEYLSWKPILDDVNDDIKDFEEMRSEIKSNLVEESINLFKFPDFKYWFFDDDDYPIISEEIKKIIELGKNKKDFYLKNPDSFNEFIEEKITELTAVVFDDETKKIYGTRFKNLAYIFMASDLPYFQNLSLALFNTFNSEKNTDFSKIEFIRGIVRKTIYEGFLKFQYNFSNNQKNIDNHWHTKKNQKENISDKNITNEENIEDLIKIFKCND